MSHEDRGGAYFQAALQFYSTKDSRAVSATPCVFSELAPFVYDGAPFSMGSRQFLLDCMAELPPW